MDIIFAIGAFQTMFMALLVITKKDRSRVDIPLITYLIITAFHLSFYIYFNKNNSSGNILAIWATGLPLLYGPLMHFYIIELILIKKQRFIWFVKHLIIFVVWGLLYNLPNFFELDFGLYVQNGFLRITGSAPAYISLFSYSAVLSGGGYSIWNIIILYKYRKNLKLNYSSIDKVNLNWVSNWAFLFLFSFLIIFIASLLPVGENFIKGSIAITVTTLITYVGFSGYKQTNIFFNFSELKKNITEIDNEIPVESSLEKANSLLSEKVKYSKSIISDKNTALFVDKLENLMIEKKSYLKDDLSLHELSEQIGISRQLLSQIINDKYKKTFYEFINDFRVKEAQEIIKDDSFNNYKITAIGYEAGFRSRSTFYKFFKKNIGITPVEYRKKQGI